MRLKSLDLVGFKSFLEPTAISFAHGITAVVGPNGCGKSNVVDAIRWVLGEQAPTRLRGKTTEDLIHAGNDSHPPAGMAEVSLLLEADEHDPLPEPYLALSEISVTRRVYRSGDSEYLLNKIPCRLKDIAEFFMAAQIHSRGYALIEQGKIEQIIQAKPEELRALVEEAAGLALFKGRREISERKLERVKENLERLNDVLGEIDRQLAFARRQAKKAEAYKLVRAELGELERLVAGRRLLSQQAELDAQSARAAALESAAETARARAAALQADFDRAAAALQYQRDGMAALAQELDNLRAGAVQRARTRDFLAKRLGAIDELEPGLLARGLELESKAVAARAARAEAGARLAREGNVEDGAGAALDQIRQQYAGAAARLAEAEVQVERLKDELAELMGEAGLIRRRLAELAGERAELAQRVAGQAPALAAALAQAQGELDRARTELEQRRQAVAAVEAAVAAELERELEARAAAEHAALALAAAQENCARMLRRTERRALEGTAEKLRSVLESLNGDGPAGPPPLLLEVVKAPAELKCALSAVLGERLSAVIVESAHFALRAIEALKLSGSGRLSFVPESIEAAAAPQISAPGIAGPLVDHLSIEPRYVALAHAMLGHVLLAEDLPSALAASNLDGHGTVFVTREGDVIWPGRIVSGGSPEELDTGATGGDGAGPLGAADAQLGECESRYQAARQLFEHARELRERVQSELLELRRMVGAAEAALSRQQAALARAEQHSALAGAQRDDALRRLEEIDLLITSSNARLTELALEDQSRRAALAAAKAELAERKSGAEKLGEAMLAATAGVEGRRARLAALEHELGHLSRLAEEVDAQIAENRRAAARGRSERAEFHAELQKLAEEDCRARAREQEIEQQAARARASCESGAAALEQQRGALRDAGEELKRLESEAVECALKVERAHTLSEELERSFEEKFRSAFAALRAELQAALEGREAARDEQRLAELRARAERIGEVNLAAESEVNELQERAAALGAQRADLEAAVRDLTHTVHKLNREARRRFADTFEGAARNFADLFPKLMRGGKARLELTSPDNLLESGINILVQPAGKKVKEIALLSGGEKALSAMALVFSLFLLNPSPFCVLDEVDAPLDEFSVAAFTALVGELKQRSQFIVITHNQRTMQVADHIHGVTMEQPGVSRIISLRLPQAA